jgi:mannose-6-phosphate isomerase-like protein (cupin superfamily)
LTFTECDHLRQGEIIVLTAAASNRHFVVSHGSGLDTPLARVGTVHKVSSALTHGQIAIVEHRLPPGVLGAPVHRHSREDELSFVISGTLGAWIGGDFATAEPGAYVWKPRDQWHTFWNAGSTELHFIELLVPGGFEGYFEQLSQMLQAASCPVPASIAALGREFGLDVDLEQTAQVCERFAVALG